MCCAQPKIGNIDTHIKLRQKDLVQVDTAMQSIEGSITEKKAKVKSAEEKCIKAKQTQA